MDQEGLSIWWVCPYGEPVIDLDDLDSLDSEDIIEGYFDGYKGEPEPMGNRSRAYWHGWRNGAVDGHHIEMDGAMRILAHRIVERDRKAKEAAARA